MTSATDKDRRLIEDWLPVNEISIESIRERSAVSALPPLNWLHVWWSRKPLTTSRAAVASSILAASASRDRFYETIGTHPGLVIEQQALDEAKISGVHLKGAYSKPRAFTHPISAKNLDWLQENLVNANPTVLDITAGGGAIPFEAGRLGIRTIANELNPVAGLILRATCEWPQKHGQELFNDYIKVSERLLSEVTRLAKDLYPEEPQPKKNSTNDPIEKQRNTQTYLFARTVRCPSCDGLIPLSLNWKLNSSGAGIRLIPDADLGQCSFEIVTRTIDQAPNTVSGAKATCPYPRCGATTPTGYIPREAQAGRMGHQLYCVIFRDSWYPITKSGRPAKRAKVVRGFRAPTIEDSNATDVTAKMEAVKGFVGTKKYSPH